jgi:Tfp pilus assembly protein PilX
MIKMKSKSLNETGFVPFLVLILLIVAAIIYLVYTRVLHLQK